MSEVDRTELVTDELYSLDVQFISDDDKYFPFEVSIYNGLLAIELCRALKLSLQTVDRSVEYISPQPVLVLYMFRCFHVLESFGVSQPP